MRWKDILNEGVVERYMPMFAAYLEAVNPQFRAQAADQVKQYIKGHRNVHQRQDRIVWQLRWMRFVLVSVLCNRQGGTVDAPENEAAALKALRDAAAGVGLNTQISRGTAAFMANKWSTEWSRKLVHFLGTPCPAIQDFVFKRQPPEEVIARFTEMEKEWRGGLTGIIHKDIYRTKGDQSPEAIPPSVFLQIDHEWAWYDLETDACEHEGEAMGHCGNNQDRSGHDTMLSLRRDLNDDLIRPSVTFICDPNGMLGEMKGRENKKPKPKYFPAIIALLKDDRISGIKGGGFEPENNFSIFDLPEADMRELIALKPALAPVRDVAEKWAEGRNNGVEDEYLKELLDREVTRYFHDEDVAGVDTQRARVNIRIMDLARWEKTECSDTAPSRSVTSFFREHQIPTTNAAYEGFLKALVPFDKTFALDGVQCEYVDGNVVTYLPYEYLAHAFTENRDHFDSEDGSCALNMQCHDAMDDWDYDYPTWNSYCDAVDWSLVPLNPKLARAVVSSVCDPATPFDPEDIADTLRQKV